MPMSVAEQNELLRQLLSQYAQRELTRMRGKLRRALVHWWLDNPGQYTEAELLRVAESRGWTNGTARHSLRICLGKGRGMHFLETRDGRWALNPIFSYKAGPGSKTHLNSR